MREKRRPRGRHVLLALLLAVSACVLPMSGAVMAVDLTQPCSVTVRASEDLTDANVVLDLYEIAKAVETPGFDAYDFQLGARYAALTIPEDAEQFPALAQQAAKIALDGDTPVLSGEALGKALTVPEAGLYLVVAHGSDLQDYVSAAGDQLVTVANSPENQYLFAPVLLSLPYRESPQAAWEYALSASLKVEITPRFGALEIEKTLVTYENADTATFVFQVDAELDGKNVYSDVVSLSFDAPGQKYVLIESLPVGAKVTVTEVYSGACYTLTSAETQTVEIPANETVTAKFVNDYDEQDRHGHGITNHFTYEAATNWGWVQLDDNSAQ